MLYPIKKRWSCELLHSPNMTFLSFQSQHPMFLSYSPHFYLHLDFCLISFYSLFSLLFLLLFIGFSHKLLGISVSDITKLCEQFNWQNLALLSKQKLGRISFQTNLSHRILVSPEYVSSRLDAQFISGSITYVRQGYKMCIIFCQFLQQDSGFEIF